MLTVKNLVKTYKSKYGEAVRALDGISIDFPDKGMVFLVGKSGSGKSTLLSVLSGLDAPDSGEVIFMNRSSKGHDLEDYFDGYRNTYIGFVFQDYNLINELTVGQNIALALQLQGRKDTASEVKKTLKAVGLGGMENRKPNSLSGGEKQRVAIARAIVKDPKIIFADEPTGALDSETGKEVLDMLKVLSADRLVVVVTHDREYAGAYGDRVIELKDGKIASELSSNGKKSAAAKTEDDIKKIPAVIQSRLPLAPAVKIGAGSLRKHPLRLALTLLVSIAAFTLFGILSTMMTYNTAYVVVNAVSGSNYSSALLSKESWHTDINNRSVTTMPEVFGKTELAGLNTKAAAYGLDFTGVFRMDGSAPVSFAQNTGAADTSSYYLPVFSWFSDCGSDYLTKNFGSGCLIAGTYPASGNEIAVSEYSYEVFEKFGYTIDGSEDIDDISSPAQLIGKTLSLNGIDMIISGIYKTGSIAPSFDTLKTPARGLSPEERETYGALKDEYNNVMQDSFYLTAYVTEGFYDTYGSTGDPVDLPAIYTTKYKPPSDGRYAYAMTPATNEKTQSNYIVNLNKRDDSADVSYKWNSALYAEAEKLGQSIKEDNLPVILIAGITFGVLSALFLFNFISVSIIGKQKEIGVLRALGAKGRDIFKIFFAESLAVALICFVLSSAFSAVACMILNGILATTGIKFAILNFNFLHVLILLGISLLVSFSGTVIPVWLAARRSPADSIRTL